MASTPSCSPCRRAVIVEACSRPSANKERGMTPTRRLLAVAGLSCAVFVASVAEARKIKPTRPEAAPPQAASAAAPPPPERVTTVEGITEYRLANGLRVLL